MLYEITNASERYTIEHDDFHVVAVAVLLLGDGRYGIAPAARTERDLSIYVIGCGTDTVRRDLAIESLPRFVREHTDAIAEALESILMLAPRERELFETLLNEIAPDRAVVLRDKARGHLGEKAAAWANTFRATRERELQLHTVEAVR